MRLALFADSAPQFLERALLAEATRRAFPLEVRSWAFTSPLAVREELAAFAPDALLLWACTEARRFPEVEPLLALPYPIYCYTAVSADDGTCGSLALTCPGTLRAQVMAWNGRLVALAQAHPQLALIDLDLLQARLGRQVTFDARLWEAASVAIAPAALPDLARLTLDALAVRAGTALHKVLVTDLDNTLWSGIVSEGGVASLDFEAPGRAAYRRWLKALAARGVLLAVASHNDCSLALEALAHLPPGLAAADFAAIEADWGPKHAQLRRIAEALHVGLDALVFIDDRAEERAAIRAELPQVAVPEVPADPALWPEALAAANLFECAQVTADDLLRATSLRDEAQRQVLAAEAPDPAAYIASLQQRLTPEPLTEANLERAAQLTQRCNQFNLRATRHTAAELVGKRGWLYRLEDRFGDLGLIAAVVVEEPPGQPPFIESWVISCRALHRGVEDLILEHLRQTLGDFRLEYVPTPRNGYCAAVVLAAQASRDRR
ncbi:MAG: HAD-IIIC family phosphatase [Candidatus Spyradenecus sp.]